MILSIKKLSEDAIVPKYEHPGDSGMDLFAVKPYTIKPFTVASIETGLAIQLPEGTEGQIRSKSGLAVKQQLFVLNSPGTIDNSYRGQVQVLLFNASRTVVSIKKHQKVGQLVVCPVVIVDSIQSVENLSETSRGDGGFGSTGITIPEQQLELFEE